MAAFQMACQAQMGTASWPHVHLQCYPEAPHQQPPPATTGPPKRQSRLCALPNPQAHCRYRFLRRLGPRPPGGSSSSACGDRMQRQTRGVGRTRSPVKLGWPAFHPRYPITLTFTHDPGVPPGLGSTGRPPCLGSWITDAPRGLLMRGQPRSCQDVPHVFCPTAP